MFEQVKQLFDKLMARWEVESVWQVVVILFIFSVTGITVLYVKRLIFELLGFGANTPYWLRAVTWLLTVLPSYQVLFLFYGLILGQFDFVWRFEKESFQKLKGLFQGRNRS
ncbi:MAG: DUF6787 family protein [Balneolaceae bacterium]|nr:DUF6787 family protein [Balneolaceae bacterium]